jgi:hypothetical protein
LLNFFWIYPLINWEVVYCFLTESTNVPINWRETKHKVVFRHPKTWQDFTLWLKHVLLFLNFIIIFPVTKLWCCCSIFMNPSLDFMVLLLRPSLNQESVYLFRFTNKQLWFRSHICVLLLSRLLRHKVCFLLF